MTDVYLTNVFDRMSNISFITNYSVRSLLHVQRNKLVRCGQFVAAASPFFKRNCV
jgi:hypothetical protein